MPDQELLAKIAQIESSRCSIDQTEMRQRILKFAMGARLDKPAEYIVITGCRSVSGFVHLWHLVKLLDYFKVDYSFLSEETCCGNSFLDKLHPKETPEDEMAFFEEHARKFESRNLERVRALGARKILTSCPGCTTRYNHFQAGGDIEIIYYTQLLAKLVDGLELDAQVDFYEGCHKHHRTPIYKIDVETSKSLIRGIKGLTVNEIPNFCCRNLSDKIFEKTTSSMIVTPTSCCWSFLDQKRKADGPQVLPLPQLLCYALGIAEPSLFPSSRSGSASGAAKPVGVPARA